MAGQPSNGPPPGAAPTPAGKTAAAAKLAGGAGGAAAKSGGFESWWAGLAKQAEGMKQQLAKTAKGIQKGVPVDVKVDFLRPTVEGVKESVSMTWKQLPPGVQQAAPFVGVAIGSGIVVFALQQHRLNIQWRKREEARMEIQNLLKERASLVRQINDLHTKPRTDVEVRLAGAVAEATNAAAAAAEAAARMVTVCAVPPRQHVPPMLPPPQMYPHGPLPPSGP